MDVVDDRVRVGEKGQGRMKGNRRLMGIEVLGEKRREGVGGQGGKGVAQRERTREERFAVRNGMAGMAGWLVRLC